ncbi:MAG TPA: FMN-binding protein [Nocardioides sp.]|nr:FMN-binding protein [Nocardioides sp.]
MRRITLWFLSTVTALVLLFSYHTSTAGAGGSAAPVVAVSGASGGADSGSGTDSGTDSGSGTDTGSGTSGSAGSQTYDGDAVQTRWGPVQVQITVEGGQIKAADVLQVPMANHHDQQINSRAVPILNAEVVDAQSADIDMVSGATDTSEGYLSSLQSAIDKAGL